MILYLCKAYGVAASNFAIYITLVKKIGALDSSILKNYLEQPKI